TAPLMYADALTALDPAAGETPLRSKWYIAMPVTPESKGTLRRVRRTAPCGSKPSAGALAVPLSQALAEKVVLSAPFGVL
ncbi:hypothetical protein, partial [Faecalibacterium prausnitzii]|uniref:hypothetical protein n=1 Tax=Faecalibacterium prausnitzii TaxID=853 RepID=UPI001A9A6D17